MIFMVLMVLMIMARMRIVLVVALRPCTIYSDFFRYDGVTFKGSFTFYALKRGSQYEVNQSVAYYIIF